MRKPQSAVRAIGSLTLANAAPVALALVTAPILARTLGPDGRGALASVLVPLALAPIVAQFGVGHYVAREAARGRPARELVGSIGLPLLLIGVAMILAAPAISSLIIPDEGEAQDLLQIGLSLLAIPLLGNLLLEITWGRQRWRLLSLVRVLPALLFTAVVVLLAFLDSVSVQSAVIATWATSFIVFIPLGWAVRDAWTPRVRLETTRKGFVFGLKNWLGTLGALANQRLDQLLMIRLVSTHDLGLYAVAVNVAALPSIVTSALGSYLLPRVASGDEHLVGRAARVSVGISVVAGAAIALVAPFGLGLVFGEPFEAALGMLLVLLLGLPALTLVSILGPSLTGAGVPAAGTYSEIAALVVTIPGLLILLPTIGAIAAAIVSSAAYFVSAAILVVIARRRFRISAWKLIGPTPSDVRWLSSALRERGRDADLVPRAGEVS